MGEPALLVIFLFDKSSGVGLEIRRRKAGEIIKIPEKWREKG
jgi:hypothetical protein